MTFVLDRKCVKSILASRHECPQTEHCLHLSSWHVVIQLQNKLDGQDELWTTSQAAAISWGVFGVGSRIQQQPCQPAQLLKF